MKIMHIGQMIGGLDIYIRNSIIASEGKNEFVIIHGKNDGNAPVICNGQKIRTYTTHLQRNLSIVKDPITLYEIISLIHKEKPDAIHCHSAKGGILGRVAGFLTDTPTFYTPHAFSFLSTKNKWIRKIYLLIERMTKFHTYLLACSESEQELGQKCVKYDKQHALVWHNAVPEKHIKEEELKEKIPNHPYICFIGRPSYQKNTLFLVKMFAKVHESHPYLHFYLLGVGYHSPEITEMNYAIEQYNLKEYFHTKSWIAQNDALNFVKHSLFYVSVSLYEGLPLSVIEAMELGKCIVASDVVGNKDCVQHKVNGYLLPLNIQEFCDTINHLVDNPEEIKQYGKESRRIFEEKFKIEKRINLLEEYYFKYSKTTF